MFQPPQRNSPRNLLQQESANPYSFESPTSTLAPVQRSAKTVFQRKALRKIDPNFRHKHIRREASNNAAMIQEGQNLMRQRSQGQAITTSSLIYLTSYQEQLFLEQAHTSLGNQEYETTTMFPAIEVMHNGTVRLYSAAKFQYSGTLDNDGLINVNHFIRISGGHILEELQPGAMSQHITFPE